MFSGRRPGRVESLATLVAITKLLRSCDLSQVPMMVSDSPPLLPGFHSL